MKFESIEIDGFEKCKLPFAGGKAIRLKQFILPLSGADYKPSDFEIECGIENARIFIKNVSQTVRPNDENSPQGNVKDSMLFKVPNDGEFFIKVNGPTKIPEGPFNMHIVYSVSFT